MCGAAHPSLHTCLCTNPKGTKRTLRSPEGCLHERGHCGYSSTEVLLVIWIETLISSAKVVTWSPLQHKICSADIYRHHCKFIFIGVSGKKMLFLLFYDKNEY